MGVSPAKLVSATAKPGFGTGVLHRTAAHIVAGHHVMVITPLGGGPVLDLLALALKARRCTVLRTTATASGGLDALFQDLADAGHNGQEAAAACLTTPAPGCDRVVLLIAQAHRLGRMEYGSLERATKAGPLQLVLAGPVDPVAHLDGNLAPFHNRICAFEPLVIEPGTPLAVLVPTAPRPPALTHAPVPAPRPFAAAGMAAPAPLTRRHRLQWPQGHVRNGWIAAIALSALVSLTGAGLRFGWFGIGPHGTPHPAAPATAHAAASFVTLPAPLVERGLATLPTKPPGVVPQPLQPHSAHRARPRVAANQPQLATR